MGVRAGRARRLLALALIATAAACGGSKGRSDPLALSGAPTDACTQAITNGHDNEAAGKEAPFLPSVRACGSLAAWLEAARSFGIDLKGREPQFVHNTCEAAGPDVKALQICREAAASVSDPRQIP